MATLGLWGGNLKHLAKTTNHLAIKFLNTSPLTSVSSISVRQFAERCVDAAPRLACIAAGITGSRNDAEDIVQQAIAIAIEKDSSFESDAHFVGWLAGIVRNCALNYRRKSNRRKTHLTDPVDLVSVETNQSLDAPVDRATGQLLPMQSSFDDRVQAALGQISPNARSCLLLRTVEELSYKEISKLMDMPEGTAMNLVHRSKKKLRELLAAEPMPEKEGKS